MSSTTSGGARSLERGLRALSLFTSERAEWTVRALAEELEIPLASTYRIVAALEAAGFLQRARSNEPYRLGLAPLRLGSMVLAGLDIRTAALPVMQRLAQEVGETALLVVPRGASVVCIENVQGTFPIRPRSLAIGERMPYNAGAIAFAVLAHLSDAELAAAFSQPFPRLTDNTLVDRRAIERRCRGVRDTGVAMSRGDVVLGTAAVAAPIFAGDGSPVAGALGITGIEERIVNVEDAVRDAAFEITQSLGGQRPL